MIIRVNTPQAVINAVKMLKPLSHIGLDTETTGLDPHSDKVLLLQLGDQEHQFIFEVAKIKNNLSPVFDLLTDPDIIKIAHNAKFDYQMLFGNFKVRTKNIVCTMLMEQLLTKGIKISGFGLADVSEKYNAGSLDKDVRKSFIGLLENAEFTEEQITYAANDVKVLPIIFSKQMATCNKRNMYDLAALENTCIPVVSEMEFYGIFLNKTKWLSLTSNAEIKAKKAKKELDDMFAPHCKRDIFGELIINYLSPTQVKPVLEKIIGTTLKTTAEKYLQSFHDDAIDKLLEYRGYMKQVTTYGSEFLKNINSNTSRIHANYLQLGTDSGRMSCRSPNMQNIPHQQEYRTPFCAQNNSYRIISADFSSQELRVLAELSKEDAFIDAIEKGRDLHCMSAALLFDMDYNDFFSKEGKVLPDMKDFRSKSKTVTFGLMYGMGSFALSKSLKIEETEAANLLRKYFRVFPKIKSFLTKMEQEALVNKYADSPLDNRRRDLSNVEWDHWKKRKHALNIAKNHPIQGASASITKLAMRILYDNIQKNKKDAAIIAVIHDEILLECHISIANEMKTLIENSMIQAFKFYCKNIPMEVDAVIANHWIH